MFSPIRNRAGRRLREPFGKAGLTVAVIALVFAMLGGAWAAAGLNSKQKKEVKKIAKSFQGSGPAGAQGPAGPQGAKGDTGAAGSNGAPGANGKSVTVTEIPVEEEECEERGGALVQQQGSSEGVEVCNGEEGEEGSPWTAGGTLPSGASETGSWSVPVAQKFSPISFPVPLAEELPEEDVHMVNAGETVSACDDGAAPAASAANPEADKGQLCVFVTKPGGFFAGPYKNGTFEEVEGEKIPVSGAGKTGALVLSFESSGFGGTFGTFAVTAP